MTGKPLRVIVGIVVAADGRVLVNQRRPGTHMAGYWEFPGGKLHAGETPRTGLVRELAEELGIRILAAEPLLILEHAYPARSVQLDVWRVTRYDGEPEGLEGQPLRWVAPADLRTLGLLPADGPIVEALLAHT
jgi:8-oxo-dGTP diphosphatase